MQELVGELAKHQATKKNRAKKNETSNTLIQFSPKRKIPRITNKINSFTPINIKAEHIDKQKTLTSKINPTNPPTLS